MAKNNFKAKEAVNDPNYAQNIGTMGQGAAQQGLDQAAQGATNLQDTFGQQKNFASMLQSAAAGTGGPTLADQAVKDVTARNNANAAGFAAGAKGLNPALAARQALMAQAGNNQQAAGQAAQTHIQEQQAARAQLGGALSGEAGTAGGQGQLGAGLFGAGSGAANQSNANLNTSRANANQVNADVAKQNASSINGALSGVMNAAGAAFGLAEGGVVPGEPEGTQSTETEIALSKGGMVPHEPAMSAQAPRGEAMPRRSFAAQVAHHLAREYFDEGGEAGHGSYDFGAGMDLRAAKPKPKPKTESGADTTQFIPHDYHPSRPSNPQHEGEDSEGKQKPSINRAFGGDVAEQSYDETQDDPDADNQPDTDQSTDMGEADEHSLRFAKGGPVDKPIGAGSTFANGELQPMDKHLENATGRTHKSGGKKLDVSKPVKEPQAFGPGYADGGDVAAGGGDESAGAAMGAMHPAVAQVPKSPGIFDHLAHSFNASPMGKLLNPGSDDAARARGVNVDGAGAPPPAAAAPAHGSKLFNFDAGGPVPGQANVPGNSLKNDVVDAKLSPGEVVLPRTIAHDPEKAKKFVEHLMQHGGSGHLALKDMKKRKN